MWIHTVIILTPPSSLPPCSLPPPSLPPSKSQCGVVCSPTRSVWPLGLTSTARPSRACWGWASALWRWAASPPGNSPETLDPGCSDSLRTKLSLTGMALAMWRCLVPIWDPYRSSLSYCIKLYTCSGYILGVLHFAYFEPFTKFVREKLLSPY